ncbi:MAG: DNA polymerase I [Bacteroidales bacterium]
MAEPKKLFLLDAMALIYRAYFALNKNPRINSKGFNTSAILGFVNTLFEVLRTENPSHIGVAFDTIAPTARHLEFADYKANREKMPEDIGLSIPLIQELLHAMDIPVLFVDGYEADDVIGTLAKKAEKEGFITYMMTPDKDFGQIVDEHIFMYKPSRMGNGVEIMGIQEVCARFGIQRPTQVIDMLGLWGDAADNIPGVPGVGEVTARKLLAQFDTIENMLANSAQITNEKLRAKIEANKEKAIASKSLATILLDVPIEFSAENLRIGKPNFTSLESILNELELRSFSNRIFAYYKSQGIVTPETTTDNKQALPLSETAKKSSKPIAAPIPDLFSNLSSQDTDPNSLELSVELPREMALDKALCHYTCLHTSEEAIQTLQSIPNDSNSAFYLWSSTSEYRHAKILSFAFTKNEDEVFYIDCTLWEKADLQTIFKLYFEELSIQKITHELKNQLHLLDSFNIDFKGLAEDVQIAHYLISPESNHELERLASKYLQFHIQSALPFAKIKPNNTQAFASLFSCERALAAKRLYTLFKREHWSEDINNLYTQVEMPLVFVLCNMEREGVKIQTQALADFGTHLREQLANLEQEIFTLAGEAFNIASPKQLGEILFDKLAITEKPKHTKTKQYSTAEDVLQKLIHKHPIVALVLQYRSISKLNSTYVEALPLLIDPLSGHIHTTYNQANTVTGRLSSQNPNLQNIPIRTEMGKEIRRAFIPNTPEDFLLAADYSQVELRIIAHLSQDKIMLDDFLQAHDIHSATAANVFGIPIKEVTVPMRRSAKMVNFGIIYGISAFGLSERLGIGRKEAAELIEKYFEKYQGISQYMQTSIEKARELGYVETMLHRRRYLPDINSSNAIVRGFAERNAINAPIQGSSADMIKIAMVNIDKAFREKNLQSKMILQVHDELICNVVSAEKEQVKNIVETQMRNAFTLSIPLEVDLKFGKNWLEAH